MFTRYYSNIILCLCYVSKMNTFKVKQCDTFVLNSGFFFKIRTEQTLQNFKSRNILHPSAIPPSMNAHVFIAKVWKQSILFYHRNNIPHFYALVIFFWGGWAIEPLCLEYEYFVTYFPNFLDFGSPLSDEGTALTGRDDQS